MPKPPNPLQPSNLLVEPTIGLLSLLAKPHVCKSVARNYEDLRDILLQIQLDVVTDTNKDEIGSVIFALKRVHDALILFQSKGLEIIDAEKREDAKAARKQ